MNKQFGKLSKRQQRRIEASYHNSKPEDFDVLMTRATREKAVKRESTLAAKSKRPLQKKQAQPKRPLEK